MTCNHVNGERKIEDIWVKNLTQGRGLMLLMFRVCLKLSFLYMMFSWFTLNFLNF